MPSLSVATTADTGAVPVDLTSTSYGLIALVTFVIAYIIVIGEEFLHMRKSKPVLVAAGLIWTLVGVGYAMHGDTVTAGAAVRHNLEEYAELLLFLLAAMTYINTMEERQIFKALRSWLISKGFSLRSVFWITGLLAFSISPFADNLTTALLMSAVVMSVAGDNKKFVVVALINIVVAANAGGAFSPFGDITTLMVWQKGKVHFHEFFELLLPSIVNWFVPAFLMSLTIKQEKPEAQDEEIEVLKGGFVVVALFALTICLAVLGHNFLHLPPVLGMMTGLGLLKVYGYYLRKHDKRRFAERNFPGPEMLDLEMQPYFKPRHRPFDIFISMKRAEWDTLMFFYGVVLCVGGLGTVGYLALASEQMYVGLGATNANILIGLLSAIVDNIPVMFAVLTMNPDMDVNQWLLITLTAGVGGSLLSIGSAAGVALMGQARGVYTFFAHLKWTWAIALGYATSIALHLLINGS
jgi:NhaD family Na+/H+ antiporter